MQRLNDNFLERINAGINLQDKHVLEIGCGNGAKSVRLATMCSRLSAIDPEVAAIATAKESYAAGNLDYAIGRAEDLKFSSRSFDVVIFSLSLRHVPIEKMSKALMEASRVTKQGGRVVILEPDFIGTFFDAELLFGASDSDERKEKAAAHFELLRTQALSEGTEYYDEIGFRFDSDQDFIDSMGPKKNLADIHDFLTKNDYTLWAQRRINIFSPAEVL